MTPVLRNIFVVSSAVMVAMVPAAQAQRDVATDAATRADTRRADELLARPITIELVGVSRANAVREVAARANVLVQYRAQTLDAYRDRVTIRVKAMPLREVLGQVLNGTTLAVVVENTGRIGIVERAARATDVPQSTGTITGYVVDSMSRQGISGVNVAIPDQRRSAVTNSDGRFIIPDVAAGTHTVTFKALGYALTSRSVTVRSEERANVQVILRQTTHILSGIVTTATGSQRKLEVGNSIVSLNVDSIMQAAPISNVTDLLESRVPGMIVQRSSGSPGDPARIRLRGTGSIDRNNDPIIVVDGARMYGKTTDKRNRAQGVSVVGNEGQISAYATPSPLDQIDPNSIQTIEVLKGPSASAMYGSDAGNGVIIITTKRGRSGPPRVNASLSRGMSYMPGKWPINWYQWITPVSGGPPRICDGFCGDATIDSVVTFQALNDKRLTALGTGTESQLSTTVSGGSQSVTYAVTASGNNTLGILKLPGVDQEQYARTFGRPAPDWMKRPDKLETRSASSGVDVTVNDRANFGITTTLSRMLQHRTSMTNSVEGAIAALRPQWIDLSQIPQVPLLGNPYERVTSSTVNLASSAKVNVLPLAWLPVNALIGVNTLSGNDEAELEQGRVSGDCADGCWRGNARNSVDLTGNLTSRIPIRNLMTLGVGLNYQRGSTRDQAGAFAGFSEGVTDPSGGSFTSRTTFSRSTTDSKSFGWFLEPVLNVNSRFFVIPGFRLDNNGLAGDNAKLNRLPKINLSWLASDESFFPLENTMQLLRLRSAFGVAGVQPNRQDVTRLYNALVLNPFGSPSTVFGDMLALTYLGNTRLRPERVTEFEGGFDTELWNGRLSMEVTRWWKWRNDAIVDAPYAGSAAGGGNLKVNVGDIRNSGIELSMTARILESRAVGFRVATSLIRNRSKVVRLGEAGQRLNFDNVRYVAGYPMEGVWARPILGYVDVNGNGQIGVSELSLGSEEVFVGSAEPDFSLTAAPALTLFAGRITVNTDLSYVSGQLQTQSNTFINDNSAAVFGMNRPGADLNAQSLYIANLNALSGIGVMQTVDVFRVQSVSISTNLGPRAARFLRARSASIALQGRNVGLWTNYTGVDPNVNSDITSHGSVDRGQLPQPRSWQLRLSLGY